ncbi:zonular occludens toxin domain-containing protein [Actinobacillus vicugnae]|uniref:zonular occludens toxin domain-containing protein n=1 Tax=Actinobacillus vicugnae TaxID=2573093 RepID=UPI001241CB71|nr:zonular occludens toxin domain-containing protein [Actinobacillus vicugnae]
MSIFAYTGIPGSGKSYEVVSSVILEAFKKGRNIVTNIEGISEEKLVAYCLSKDKKASRESLGTLIKVTDEDCQKEDFFPFKGAENSFCKAGDLICLDEVWRIFPSDKIHQNHRSFIAEHRHFTNEKGDCCDLIVINQSITGIPRFIKDRIESTFVMRKMTMLGFSKRYRVDVFIGVKTSKTALIAQYHNKYDDEIFKLYKSFDGVNGKQNVIDSRQNFFKSSQFKLILFSSVICLGGSFYYLSELLGKYEKKPDETHIENIDNKIKNNACVKLISINTIGDLNYFIIKKGDNYERIANIDTVNVCNIKKFRR